MFRKPIALNNKSVLCDDGSIWTSTTDYEFGDAPGESFRWIRLPDIPQPEESEIIKMRGEMVGVCRACHKAIWEQDDWNFSVENKWMEHAYEEDCVK